MMIPAHAWGAIERRHGTRRVLTDWWIVVDVPGTGRERDDQGKDIEPMGQGAAALIDNAAPDNAWHGTARDVDHGDEGDELVELLTEAVPADPHARAVLLMRVGQRLTEELVLRVAAWGQDPDSALRTEATVDSLLARALLIRGRA